MAIPLRLSYTGQVRPALLLTVPMEQTTRVVQQTSGFHLYAVISVRFAPWGGPDPATPVVFINAADVDPDDPLAPTRAEFDQYVRAVAHGCADGLNHLAADHLPLVNLCITLTAIRTHPVDSRPLAFERAGTASLHTFVRDATFTPVT